MIQSEEEAEGWEAGSVPASIFAPPVLHHVEMSSLKLSQFPHLQNKPNSNLLCPKGTLRMN